MVASGGEQYGWIGTTNNWSPLHHAPPGPKIMCLQTYTCEGSITRLNMVVTSSTRTPFQCTHTHHLEKAAIQITSDITYVTGYGKRAHFAQELIFQYKQLKYVIPLDFVHTSDSLKCYNFSQEDHFFML